MNKKLLTADIGGTHTRFMTFNSLDPIEKVEYNSKNFITFEQLLEHLFQDHPHFHSPFACFAFPGIVGLKPFPLTNLPWIIQRDLLMKKFGFKEVYFLNDLQAGAYGLLALPKTAFKILQEGHPQEGSLALISPGTGLGESFLTLDRIAFATESGHADFGPDDPIQVELWNYLKSQFGHVSYEHVLSGPGIWNIYSFLKTKEPGIHVEAAVAEEALMHPEEAIDKGEAIWMGAFKYHDHLSIQTLRLFTKCLAQEAGNLALHTLAKQGVCIGGGIAPNLLPYLEEESFLDTFCHKGPMSPFLQSIPIKVVLDQRSSLFGCAWYYLHGIR